MAATGKLFYRAVQTMERADLILYISKYSETFELKVLLNTFDELRKGCVLNEEMNKTLEEIKNQLKEMNSKEPEPLTVGQIYLKMLEGRILMLLLIQSIARDLKNEKRAFLTGQQVTALFTEYVLEGGKRSFQSPRYSL